MSSSDLPCLGSVGLVDAQPCGISHLRRQTAALGGGVPTSSIVGTCLLENLFPVMRRKRHPILDF